MRVGDTLMLNRKAGCSHFWNCLWILWGIHSYIGLQMGSWQICCVFVYFFADFMRHFTHTFGNWRRVDKYVVCLYFFADFTRHFAHTFGYIRVVEKSVVCLYQASDSVFEMRTLSSLGGSTGYDEIDGAAPTRAFRKLPQPVDPMARTRRLQMQASRWLSFGIDSLLVNI